MNPSAVTALIARGLELTADGVIDQHIRTSSSGKLTLTAVQAEGAAGPYSTSTRQVLGAASKIRKAGWFKFITKMEGVARDILGPALEMSDAAFVDVIKNLFGWAHADA